MAVVDAMVARHFGDEEIWQTLEGSALYARRVEKKGEAHARALYGDEIEKARGQVQLFDRDPGEERRYSGSSDPGGDTLPEIVITDKHMRDLSDEAWAALERSNVPPHLFQHGSGVARVSYDEEEHRFVLQHIDAPILKGLLDRRADWMKVTKQGIVPARPPTDVIQDMLSGIKPLPIIRGIVGTPVVSAEGIFFTDPGFQPETSLYYAPDGLEVPAVPAQPSSSEVEAAIHLIQDEWLGDFPFVDLASRTNAIGAALTPLAREMIAGPTPLHITDAPAPGTGKGLFTETLSIVVTGNSAGVMNDTRSEEEMRKRLTSLLMEGTAVALIDNVKYELDSATLAAVLTSEIWVDRQMGINKVLRLRNRTLWLATGNNMKLSHEVSRRTVSIRLDSKVDRPWERQGFRHPQLGLWVRQHRHELVWALLTLIQNWLAQGKPAWAGKLLGTYEAWSAVIGGILQAAGIEGLMENREELYSRADSETEEWRAFVGAWWDRHAQEPVRTADLVPLARDEGHLGSLFKKVKDGASERSFSTRLGTALSAMRDRRFNRHFIRHLGGDGHDKVAMYRLEPAEDAGPSEADVAGPAKVPHKNGDSSDSNAGPAGPAGPQLASELREEDRDLNRLKTITVDEGAIEVTQDAQVPQPDSKAAQKHAGPVAETAVEVPHKVPQSGWVEEVGL